MRFIAMRLALRIVLKLRPIIARIKRHNRSLADQADRAGDSVPLNLGEGNRRTGRDRKYHFSISSGSAEEVRTALYVAIAKGYLTESLTEDVLGDIDQLQAILWKLTH